MIFEQLGGTQVKVSKICLGTMTFGEQNTEKEGHGQLDYAVAHGVNFIDTAEMYSIPPRKETQGSTERIIGTWLAKSNKRRDVVLATKIVGPAPSLLHIRNPLNFSHKQINLAVEGSLKRLQTDYIDLYQLHWPERNTNCFGQLGYRHGYDEQWEDNMLQIIQSMNGLISQGKIRHWGLSNETSWGAMRFIYLAKQHHLQGPVTIQNPYGLLNRSYEVGLAEVSMREKVGLLAYSPLGMGMLTGKYDDGKQPEGARLTMFPQYKRYTKQESITSARLYNQLACDHGLTPALLALAFVNQQPFVCSNIIGATTMGQLKENIESTHVKLGEDVLGEIEKIHKKHPYPAP